jgi:hypothetical protein
MKEGYYVDFLALYKYQFNLYLIIVNIMQILSLS